MKPSGKSPSRHPSWAALALALALSLAACEQKPPEAPVGRATEQPAAKTTPRAEQAAVMQTEQPQAAAAKPGGDQAARDAALAAAVKAALVAEPGLKAHAIDVVAADGVVTLYGTADTPENRDKAVRIASGVQGVTAVNHKLVIVSGS